MPKAIMYYNNKLATLTFSYHHSNFGYWGGKFSMDKIIEGCVFSVLENFDDVFLMATGITHTGEQTIFTQL